MNRKRTVEQRIRILSHRRDGLIYQLRRDIASDRDEAERRVDRIDQELALLIDGGSE